MQYLIEFIVIALACIVTGSVLVVVRLHFMMWRRVPKPQGILPLHVWLVSIGHLCFVTGTGQAALEAMATDRFTWRFILYIVGSLFTVVSLVAVAKHVRRRPATS